MNKLFKVGIALLLVVTMYPKKQVSASTFSDVPETHAYYQEIMFLLDKGVISSGSKYGVNDKVTREEVAVMVSKAVGLDGKQTATKFPDVPASHRSSGYINSAVEAGIINGYLDGTFKPNEKVTRGHMAAFIARGFKLTQEANVTFKDVPKGSTSYEAVRKLAFRNITTGYEDGTFKPNENLSRAHISVFIARAMGFKKDGTGNGTPTTPAPTPKPEPVPTPKPDGSSGLHVIPGAPTSFKNCTEMRQYYPQGVKDGHPAYATKHDRDKDGWACEK